MLRKCPFRRESESILGFRCEPARQPRLRMSVDAVGLRPIRQPTASIRSNRTAVVNAATNLHRSTSSSITPAQKVGRRYPYIDNLLSGFQLPISLPLRGCLGLRGGKLCSYAVEA
jgi:hypothetical protein